MSKVAIILSGSGCYDGSEIQEVVLSLLILDNLKIEVECYAPDIEQAEVINHMDGKKMQETRNVLVESARIARGEIKPLSEFDLSKTDGLLVSGGLGASKNLTAWSDDASEGDINKEVSKFINKMMILEKPVAGMGMGVTTIARAIKGTSRFPQLTIGEFASPSPYNIEEIAEEMKKCGATYIQKNVNDVLVDQDYLILSTPAYMMEARITEVFDGIEKMLTLMGNIMLRKK